MCGIRASELVGTAGKRGRMLFMAERKRSEKPTTNSDEEKTHTPPSKTKVSDLAF